MVVIRYSRRYSQAAKSVQKKLHDLGYYIVIDGYFGTNSVLCLKEFQADRKLVVDGICGPKTQSELKKPEKCKFQAYQFNLQTKVFKMRKDILTADKINTLAYYGSRRLSVLSIWRKMKKKPTLIINGGLFDMKSGHPLTIAKDEGKNTGSVYYDREGLKIDGSGRVSFGADDNNTRDFLGGSPMVHKNWKLLGAFKDLSDSFVKNRHPRQYVCENDEYMFVIFVYGRSSWRGWYGENIHVEAPKTIYKVGGTKNSMNNDGGSSLQARLKTGKNGLSTWSYRSVPNAIAFYVEGR